MCKPVSRFRSMQECFYPFSGVLVSGRDTVPIVWHETIRNLCVAACAGLLDQVNQFVVQSSELVTVEGWKDDRVPQYKELNCIIE